MRLRWIAFSLITLCMIGGLVAGIYAPSIEVALTAQPTNPTRAGSGLGTPPPSRSPTPGQPMPATPSATPPGNVSVLALDTFHRAAQVFWGTASDGHTWDGDANSIEVFSVAQNSGLIANGQGAFNAILGPVTADAEAVVSATINHFAANDVVNLGVALRWTDSKNWYKALINGSQLQILSRVQGVTKTLATLPFTARDGVSYTLRFRVMGANLLAKTWQTGQPEPATWLLQATDTALTQGMGGIRVVLQSATIIQVSSFLETTLNTIEDV